MWTDVKIPQFTRFGPYEGVKQPVKDIKQDEVSGYGWLVSIVHNASVDCTDMCLVSLSTMIIFATLLRLESVHIFNVNSIALVLSSSLPP